MSDETPPPSLRLRPRSRSEDAPPPASVPVPSVEAEPSGFAPMPAAVEPPRLRLKPKLAGEPAAAGSADEPVAMPAPEVVAAPPPPVAPVTAAEPAESEPPSRLRLRPKLSNESADAADSSVVPAPESKDVPLKHVESPGLKHPSLQASASPGGAPAPVPFTEPPIAERASLPKEMSALPPLVSEPAANAVTPVAPLPAFHLVAAPGATEATFVQQPPKSAIPVPVPVRASAFCPRRIAMVFIALILIVVGYYGYRALFASKPAAPIEVAPPAVALAPAKPLTAKAVGEMPAKLITKAQDTVMAKRESEQSRVDQLVEGREPIAASVPKLQPAVVSNPAPLSTPTVSPPLTPPKVSEPPPPVPVASLAFRAWVDSAKITGVLEGATPRAIINGRLARPGESMDPTLGILFTRVDIGRRQIIFSDHSGAMVGKSY